MTVMATAAREVGIALLLVPVPLVIALLVGAARSDRVNAFLVWIVGLSLLPAIWRLSKRRSTGTAAPIRSIPRWP